MKTAGSLVFLSVWIVSATGNSAETAITTLLTAVPFPMRSVGSASTHRRWEHTVAACDQGELIRNHMCRYDTS